MRKLIGLTEDDYYIYKKTVLYLTTGISLFYLFVGMVFLLSTLEGWG